MSLTTEDVQILNKLNAVFATIEAQAEEAGLTPDEYLEPTKKYLVGGVAYFEKDIPVVNLERANIFAKATGTVTEAKKATK